MFEEEVESAVKVLVVGDGAVGKSSLIQRYCKGIYTDAYKKTIGVDFLERQIQVQATDLRLMIWDTAGQEEFDAITKSYYRDAEACVVAFSTTDRTSFEAVESWIAKVEAECGPIPMVLIQNKIDLVEQAVMTREESEELAKKVALKFYRTSVQENYNVNEVFTYLCELFLERKQKDQQTSKSAPSAAIGGGKKPDASSKRTSFSVAGGKKDAPAAKEPGGFKITAEEPKRRTGGKKSGGFANCALV